jgi:nitroreductase
MELWEAIRKRRSIRKYKEQPVEEEKLDRVLEAGRLAPSAGNRQEWKYIVVQDQATREELAEAANGQRFVAEAGVCIVCCGAEAEHVMSCGQASYPIDVAISVDHMTLAAVEEGLGTCWIGAFKESAVKELLGIPEDVRVVALLPLGYPDMEPKPRLRKPLSEIVCQERWSD